MFIKLTDSDTSKSIYYNFDHVKTFEEKIQNNEFKYTVLNLTYGTALVKERARDIYLKLEVRK